MQSTKLPKLRSKTYAADLQAACPPLLHTNVSRAKAQMNWAGLSDEEKKSREDSNVLLLDMPLVLDAGPVHFQTYTVSHVIT
jgi:hypothetical protein